MSCMSSYETYDSYEPNQANPVTVRGPICALIWEGGAEILRDRWINIVDSSVLDPRKWTYDKTKLHDAAVTVNLCAGRRHHHHHHSGGLFACFRGVIMDYGALMREGRECATVIRRILLSEITRQWQACACRVEINKLMARRVLNCWHCIAV